MTVNGQLSRLELVSATGRVRASVSRRAAALRELSVDGIALIERTMHRVAPPGMSGAVLVPWPNRVQDATWHHEGRELHLVVTEPELGHALHGLISATDLDVEQSRADEVALSTVIDAADGYPFRLGVRVIYRLRPDGMRAEIVVSNRGEGRAPVAIGVHPYPRIGGWTTVDLLVSIDADYEWELDARHIPVRRRPERASGVVPRALHRVRDGPSHAVFERRADLGGDLVHTLIAPDGRTVEVRADRGLRWTQWYLEPALDTDEGPRYAVAVEPMSAPPNALRTGHDLRWLSAGESTSWTWAIRLL